MPHHDDTPELQEGVRFLSWHVGDYPITCPLLIAQGLCYALLRLWEVGKLPAVAEVFVPLYLATPP